MRISVITPSFNHARYLPATLDSVRMQYGVEVEHIVVDGGSKDGTIEILRNWEGPGHQWISEPDVGQTDAINKGLRLATGELLAYLNSDDIYYPEALVAVADYFSSHPGCQIAYGDADHLNEDGSFMKQYPTEPWDYERLQETCFICQPAVFWRRAVIERFGLFDERFHISLDYEYWLRVGAHLPFHYLRGKVLAGSRMYPQNKTMSQRVRGHEETLDIVARYATSLPPVVHWLKVLADIRATRESRADSTFQEHVPYPVLKATWLLLYAEEYQIPLDSGTLRELSVSFPQKARNDI